ncbi:MAG: hypothetical protein RJQ08_03795 [Salinisphaeraceae bacterium]
MPAPLYALIFRAPRASGAKFALYLTPTPSIVGHLPVSFHATLRDAKSAAKSAGAEPHNYL